MEFEKVDGKAAGKIRLFALSTCIWCRKTRNLLEDSGVAFEYIYIDLLEGEAKDEAVGEIEKVNPRLSFPTLVFGDEVIIGFKEDRIKELLGS